INAAIGLVVMAVLSVVWNQRYVGGYLEGRRANRAMRQGDWSGAAQWMEGASRLIPEAKLEGAAAVFRRAALLPPDPPAEALPFLMKAKAATPGIEAIENAVALAEQGVAFDAKDYDTFLAKSQEMSNRHPKDAFAVAGVASAYACKYAVTGSEAFRTQSLALLDKARALSRVDPARFKEYEERIRYRLETREIIDKAEYDKRFPQGRTR